MSPNKTFPDKENFECKPLSIPNEFPVISVMKNDIEALIWVDKFKIHKTTTSLVVLI